MKILIILHLLRFGQKKVVLFLETSRVKKFLSLTRSHSRMCIRTYIFNFKKQAKKKKAKQSKNTKKAKETKEEKKIFPESRLKK